MTNDDVPRIDRPPIGVPPIDDPRAEDWRIEDGRIEDWRIERAGRAWARGEARQRLALAPARIEVVRGRLFWSERERLVMLALLLENCGMDAALRLGDPGLWRDALWTARRRR